MSMVLHGFASFRLLKSGQKKNYAMTMVQESSLGERFGESFNLLFTKIIAHQLFAEILILYQLAV